MHTSLADNRILYMRNLIFGAEDSLVSTVGLLSGIAIGGVPKSAIILTGIVLIFVEAFSMGVGSYLSEYSVEAARLLISCEIIENAIMIAGFIQFIQGVGKRTSVIGVGGGTARPRR